jgi:hypothetical protein
MANDAVNVDILPSSFRWGFTITIIGWAAMTLWDKTSNFLVLSGLLVSSRKEHFFTLPFVGTGVTLRTIAALIGVAFVVGGLCYLLASPQALDEDEPILPAAQSMRPPMDPYGPSMGMGGMGMGMNDPYGPPMGGGMGGPPMGGMF